MNIFFFYIAFIKFTNILSIGIRCSAEECSERRVSTLQVVSNKAALFRPKNHIRPKTLQKTIFLTKKNLSSAESICNSDIAHTRRIASLLMGPMN